MQTGNEVYTIDTNGWTVKVQPPPTQREQARVMLLLHGWTGDESVMWIFTHKVPKETWLFAPRGQVQSPGGGYGWLPHAAGQGAGPGSRDWPALDAFADPAEALMQAFQDWRAEAGAPQDSFDVMGFSQGAALAYALGAYYPDQVRHVIALAGFLPQDRSERGLYQVYQGKPVYVAHGSADEIVPVELAQEAVRTLQGHGAQVTYCESEVGHKLSASCLRGLEAFAVE